MDIINDIREEYKEYLNFEWSSLDKLILSNRIRLDVINAALFCLTKTNFSGDIDEIGIDEILSTNDINSYLKKGLDEIVSDYIKQMTKFANDIIYQYRSITDIESFGKLSNFIECMSKYFRNCIIHDIDIMGTLSIQSKTIDSEALDLVGIGKEPILTCINYVHNEIFHMIKLNEKSIRIFINYYAFANLYKGLAKNDIVNYKDVIPFRNKFNGLTDRPYGIVKSFLQSIKNELILGYQHVYTKDIPWNYIRDYDTLFDNIIVYSKIQRDSNSYFDVYIYGNQLVKLLRYLRMSFSQFLNNEVEVPEGVKIESEIMRLDPFGFMADGNIIVYMHLSGDSTDIQRLLTEISNAIRVLYELKIQCKLEYPSE